MPSVAKNTALYAIGNIIPRAAGFVLLPIYTRYLTPADYGIVNSMQVLNTVLALVLTLAVERSIYRLYWDHKTDSQKRDFLGTIAIALTGVATLVLVLLFLGRGLVGMIFKSIPFSPFYVYAIVTAYVSVFDRIPKIYLQLQQRAGRFVILSVVQFVVNTAFILWFIVALRAGAAGMLKGQLIGCALMLPVFVFILVRICRFTVRPQILKASLRFSLPMIPALLCAWILNLSDRIFIERYFSLADVGIYSLGYKIGGLVLILSAAFNMAYEPLFYRLANADDQAGARKKLFLYNNTYIMTILGVCFLISLFSREAIVLLLDARYVEAYKIVPIIALAYFVSQSGALMNRSIYQEKKTIAIMVISIFGAALNIGLNFLLVPLLGAYGAAVATLLSFSCIFMVQYWYAKKCYFVPYDWKRIALGILVCIGLERTFHYVEIEIVMSLFVKIGVLLIAALLWKNRIQILLNVCLAPEVKAKTGRGSV